MNTDEKIDELVKQINAAPREPKLAYEVPPSVRLKAVHDETYESRDWNIMSCDTIDWVEDLEAKLPGRFPKSFRSLITRYIFPQFEIGDLELLANTPEGVSGSHELRTGIFNDKYLSAALLQNGFIQFARPAGGS